MYNPQNQVSANLIKLIDSVPIFCSFLLADNFSLIDIIPKEVAALLSHLRE
jgi:hypothetical protein